MLGIVASRNGRSRNGRVRNGRSRISRSRIGTSTDVSNITNKPIILDNGQCTAVSVIFSC